MPPHRVAHDIAHELGHAWDARFLDDRARARYLRGRGVPGVQWWPSGPGDDYATGAGDFAEMFARCHAAAPEFRSRLGPAAVRPLRRAAPERRVRRRVVAARRRRAR